MTARRIAPRFVGLIAFACIVVFLVWWFFSARATSPRVAAAIARLHETAIASQSASPENPTSTTRAHPPTGIGFNPVALSSFVDSEHIAGLSDEQLARLEMTLQTARRETYRLIVERGLTKPLPNGYEIELPAQGDELAALKRQVYRSIEMIVGNDRMDEIERRALGPKFDAKFAYFGAYPATIRLTFNTADAASRRDPRDLLTIQSQYRKVAFPGFGSGRIASTSVLYLSDFERDFFKLPSLPRKP